MSTRSTRSNSNKSKVNLGGLVTPIAQPTHNDIPPPTPTKKRRSNSNKNKSKAVKGTCSKCSKLKQLIPGEHICNSCYADLTEEKAKELGLSQPSSNEEEKPYQPPRAVQVGDVITSIHGHVADIINIQIYRRSGKRDYVVKDKWGNQLIWEDNQVKSIEAKDAYYEDLPARDVNTPLKSGPEGGEPVNYRSLPYTSDIVPFCNETWRSLLRPGDEVAVYYIPKGESLGYWRTGKIAGVACLFGNNVPDWVTNRSYRLPIGIGNDLMHLIQEMIHINSHRLANIKHFKVDDSKPDRLKQIKWMNYNYADFEDQADEWRKWISTGECVGVIFQGRIHRGRVEGSVIDSRLSVRIDPRTVITLSKDSPELFHDTDIKPGIKENTLEFVNPWAWNLDAGQEVAALHPLKTGLMHGKILCVSPRRNVLVHFSGCHHSTDRWYEWESMSIRSISSLNIPIDWTEVIEKEFTIVHRGGGLTTGEPRITYKFNEKEKSNAITITENNAAIEIEEEKTEVAQPVESPVEEFSQPSIKSFVYDDPMASSLRTSREGGHKMPLSDYKHGDIFQINESEYAVVKGLNFMNSEPEVKYHKIRSSGPEFGTYVAVNSLMPWAAGSYDVEVKCNKAQLAFVLRNAKGLVQLRCFKTLNQPLLARALLSNRSRINDAPTANAMSYIADDIINADSLNRIYVAVVHHSKNDDIFGFTSIDHLDIEQEFEVGSDKMNWKQVDNRRIVYVINSGIKYHL